MGGNRGMAKNAVALSGSPRCAANRQGEDSVLCLVEGGELTAPRRPPLIGVVKMSAPDSREGGKLRDVATKLLSFTSGT